MMTTKIMGTFLASPIARNNKMSSPECQICDSKRMLHSLRTVKQLKDEQSYIITTLRTL
jgi:hypothetical protein